MKCSECPWCWAEKDEEYPSCKYHYNDGYAPCEIDEKAEETEDEI